MMPALTNTDRKRLSGYLHTANVLVNGVKRGSGLSDMLTPDEHLANASDLIKQVIGELMDAPGMTDFYGNPTCTTNQEERTQ
jgi:hypothetical protein